MSGPAASLSENKEKKYDRQLRLWGQEGQQRLENAHICLLGSGPSATETMKNLVLPGVGRFTVVDDVVVSDRDLGNNFFVEASSVGKSRAEEVARLLHELNDFVLGANAIKQSPTKLVAEKPDFVKDYSLIIGTELNEKTILALGKSCWTHRVPLVLINTNGLLAQMRIQTPEHTVIESKPDFPPVDLRLSSPFPALRQYADSVNLDALDSTEHSHVPYPVLLIKAMDAWRANHDGAGPANQTEKDLFKESVLTLARKEEDNFTEAYTQAHLAYKAYEIPMEVSSILDSNEASNLTSSSSNFWFIANGIKQFVANEGKGSLPLMGSIPDMHSDTQSFVHLQGIYKAKATADAEAVHSYVKTSLAAAGLPETRVSRDEINLMCKNSLFLMCIRYRSIETEFSPDSEEKLFSMLPFIDFQTMLPGEGLWYIALRAALRFEATHGHLPGSTSPADDEAGLRFIADELITEMGIDSETLLRLDDEYVKEICRYGGAQLHNIAAIIGGTASQEIIKLITHQWQPMNNTFIFNGIRASSAVFEA